MVESNRHEHRAKEKSFLRENIDRVDVRTSLAVKFVREIHVVLLFAKIIFSKVRQMKLLGYLSIRAHNFEEVLSFFHEKLFMYFNKGKYSDFKRNRKKIEEK